MHEFFSHLARRAAEAVGTYWAFLIALTVVAVWAFTGPFFHFSDTWQLVINTGTTIVTFLMVFLLQYAQNRDSKAIQLKLDEIIKSIDSARNSIIDLESLTDDQLAALESEYKRLCTPSTPPAAH